MGVVAVAVLNPSAAALNGRFEDRRAALTGGDALARILAERMRVSLGQPVIVENITGAGGSVGTGRVARAAPDGYSLILGGWATHVVNAATINLPYDVIKDFEPVGMVVTQPLILVGNNAFAPKTLQELVGWLKTNPDKASVGTSGVGSANIEVVPFTKMAFGRASASASPRSPVLNKRGRPRSACCLP